MLAVVLLQKQNPFFGLYYHMKLFFCFPWVVFRKTLSRFSTRRKFSLSCDFSGGTNQKRQEKFRSARKIQPSRKPALSCIQVIVAYMIRSFLSSLISFSLELVLTRDFQHHAVPRRLNICRNIIQYMPVNIYQIGVESCTAITPFQ